MKRIVVVILSCFVLSMMAVSPAQSYTNPSYSDADAVATALAAYNTADSAYNSALNAYNSANAAYNAAKTNFDNAKAAFDAAVIENSAAVSALNTAITSANAATKYMQDCQYVFACPQSVLTAAVNDWYAKQVVYFAALDRQNLSLTNFNSCRDAYNAAIPLYNATVVPNNNAANNLGTATAVKTAAYNLYVAAKATADNNGTTNNSSPKITIPKNVATSTTINAPVIIITKHGTQALVKKYRNCADLRKVFPKGVAKNAKSARNTGATVNTKVYLLNIGFDREKAGTACGSP